MWRKILDNIIPNIHKTLFKKMWSSMKSICMKKIKLFVQVDILDTTSGTKSK